MRTSRLLLTLAVISVPTALARPRDGHSQTTTTTSASTETSTWTSSATGTSASSHTTTSPTSVLVSSSKTKIASQQALTCSAPVPGDFVGFGFETAFLNDYTVGTLSENLVNSVVSRLGETVIIRIGCSSGDRVLFDLNQSEATNCVDGDCPTGSGATFILGPSYFDGFDRFTNQHFSFQAPLSPVLNITGSLDYVTRAYEALGADRVAAIAIGNEPDVYASNYTTEDYVDNALRLERRIKKALNLPNERIFEVPDSAGPGEGSNFTVQEIFNEGIDNNGRVKYAAQHWYQLPTDLETFTPQTLQQYLMNHSAITSKYSSGYSDAIAYLNANDPSVYYVISESGSSLGGPPQDFQATFGATLCAVDFNLYSMSLGVKRLDSTQRPAAPYSLWVPDTSANNAGNETNIGPEVRAPYFASPFVADFLGTSSGSVVELLGDDTRTAYAIYDSSSSTLSKVALINLNYWSADTGSLTGGPRGNTTFSIPVSQGQKSVIVKRLHADSGAHAQGYDVDGNAGIITWAGETWSYSLDNGSGHFVKDVSKQEKVKACNGVANIVVPDLEGVIVYLE